MKKRNIWFLSIVLVVGICLVVWKWFDPFSQRQLLSDKEVIDRVETLYQGTSSQSAKNDHTIVVTLTSRTGTFEVSAEAGTGKILAVEKKAATGNAVPAKPDENSTPTDSSGLIGEQEALRLASTVVEGTLDDEVELEEENGVPYYFVEFENASGKEGKIQIHALNGEVESISWDD